MNNALKRASCPFYPQKAPLLGAPSNRQKTSFNAKLAPTTAPTKPTPVFKQLRYFNFKNV